MRNSPRLSPHRFILEAAAALAVLAAAEMMRHGLVEPERVALRCADNLAPWWSWASLQCAGRDSALAGLRWNAYGNGSVIVALGALLAPVKSVPLARAALYLGIIGLVLYSYETSAVGALLALIALTRAHAQHRGGEQQA